MDPEELKHLHGTKQAFEHMEILYPTIPTTAPRTTRPTKINIIIPNIPLMNARIMNVTFLSLGAALNLLIILVILLKSSMRTSMNLYIISLACANMVILIEPLEETLRWFFDVHMKLNMDYVLVINFDVSVITIVILKFMVYINVFQKYTPFGKVLLRKYTSIKGILLVWITCTVSVAIGLHIFDYFEGDMADIYVCETIMFVFMPLIMLLALSALIIYELKILKDIEGYWRARELRQFVTLVIIAIVFFLIRAPYRLARAINFIEPKALCCTNSKREVLYFMAKTFPILFAIIYISMCNEFRQALQDIMRCRCKPSKEICDTDVVI